MAEDGMTLNQIGEDLDVSGERVRQLEKRALARMRRTVDVDE
jgi:DNA-directed RNA polymerase sigma subunit (sigma70/sigma32)